MFFEQEDTNPSTLIISRSNERICKKKPHISIDKMVELAHYKAVNLARKFTSQNENDMLGFSGYGKIFSFTR